MPATSYERVAGFCAVGAGIAGFLYSVAFVVLQHVLLQGLFLLIGGVLSMATFVALYHRLMEVGGGFALLALLLGVVGGVGAAVHGGFDLANALNPPPTIPDLPSAIDPRGLLTFGFTGLSILIISWLMRSGPQFPKPLSALGYVLAVLLLVLYVGRLVVVDAKNSLIVVPALLTGFIVNPAWYVWLGLTLWRGR
jgi:hypothetical protein